MKQIKKWMCTVLALSTVFATAACGNPQTNNSGTTEIRIMNYGGGIGRVWLDEACARFQEANKGVSFEEGKTGVSFKIEHNISTNVATMKSAAYNIYFDENTGSIEALARSNSLLNISDVLEAEVDGKTIESKIDASALDSCKGGDGEYYAIPSNTWYPGVTYDRELFEEKGLFFAASGETNVTTYQSTLTGKTYRFVKNATAKRSCGIDGKYSATNDDGASDDGLPSSIEELIVLCEKMKKVGVTPFTYTGASSHYVHYLLSSIWTSLSGYDQMRATYDFAGNVEVVTGYEESNLFAGISYIKKPKTKVVTVQEAEGYNVTRNVNRYYAMSFMEIATRENWFSTTSTTGSKTHIDAQQGFVWSDYQGEEAIGMLVEGNYWYNESVVNQVFTDFHEYNPEVSERKLAWLPMPVLLNGTIAENEGKQYTMLDTSDSYAFLNKNMEGKDGLIKACKEFLKFLCTDAELSHFTGSTGIVKAHYNYELQDADYDKMSYFQKTVYDRVFGGNAKIIFCSAENDTFNNNKSFFRITTGGGLMEPKLNNETYETYIHAFRAGKTAQYAFETTSLDATDWAGIYKGE